MSPSLLAERRADPLACAMPSLIVATLSLDDAQYLRPTMRPPLVWLSVWNVRAMQNLT